MQPTEQNNVWISREEYNRLQAAAQPAAYAVPQPVVSGYFDASVSSTAATKTSRLQILVAVLLGGGLLLALSTNQTSIASILLAVFLVWAVYDGIRHPRKKGATVQSGSQPNSSVGRTVAKTLLIVTGLVLLVPVLFSGLMILFFIVIVGAGGGRGS